MFIRLRLNSEYSKFLTALLYKTQFRLYNCKCTSILFCLFRSLKKREAYLSEKKILTSWWIKLLQSLQGNEWLRVKYILDVIYLKGIQLPIGLYRTENHIWLNMAEKIWTSRMLLPPTFIYLRLISKQLNSRKMSFFYTCNCLCKIFFITISW